MGMQKHPHKTENWKHPRKPRRTCKSGQQKPARKTKKTQRAPARPQVLLPQEDIQGFFAALFALIAPQRFQKLAQYRNSKRGRPPELPLSDLLASLLFHFLCSAGTASEHLFHLLGRQLSDSSISA